MSATKLTLKNFKHVMHIETYGKTQILVVESGWKSDNDKKGIFLKLEPKIIRLLLNQVKRTTEAQPTPLKGLSEGKLERGSLAYVRH